MGTRRFSLIEAANLGNSGSFTLPIDYDASGSLTVLCIGGGGGGGKRATSAGSAGGGGGGALAQGSFSGLKTGQVIYYSLGLGGAGGTTTGGQAGADGGDTWVNISSNAVPTTTSNGVLAKGGFAGLNAITAGGGGGSAQSIGSLGTASGGNGGQGGSVNGSGGGGGGAAGRYTFADNTYGTGGAGGGGRATADGGGGGGGGVEGAGGTALGQAGASGGLGYGSASGGNGGAAGGSGGYGSDATNPGAGGGGGGGASSNSGFGGLGARSAPSFTILSGALANNYGYSSGGGGGGGGSNNSGSTGGTGGPGHGLDANAGVRAFGGGGGGGGSGVSVSGNGGNGGNGVIVLIYTAKTTMLPTTNLSFANIQSYFGGSNPIALTEYYRSVVTGTGLVSLAAQNNTNTPIPASGTISVSNFRGAPFKLYREIEAGALIQVSKFFISVTAGYQSTLSMGSINSTAFTLSGGSGVAIKTLTTTSLGALTFAVSSTSAVSNSGWDYLIIDETTATSAIFPRAEATFSVSSTEGVWSWSNGQFYQLRLGSDYVVKFV